MIPIPLTNSIPSKNISQTKSPLKFYHLNAFLLYELQSISESVHVTSDEKVFFFFVILGFSALVSYLQQESCRGKWRLRPVCGIVWIDHVTYLQESSYQRPWTAWLTFSQFTRLFDFYYRFFGKTILILTPFKHGSVFELKSKFEWIVRKKGFQKSV